ncbi:hypothetical protein MYX06_00920 [Patescibacteria group bacterium AH-259-L05]|nr:hypothetical protein [Patescibacteria group bacterium AH-259-L05]
MKKILTSLMIGLLISLTSDLNARNKINYRPTTWKHYSISLGDNSEGFELWISDRLDSTLRAATPEIINNIFTDYSKLFSGFRWQTQDYTFTKFRFFYKDSVTVAADDTLVTNWMDKNRTYVIYANLEDFLRQQISPGFTQALGFFQHIFGFRIAVPYPGSYALYEYILRHESAHAWMYQLMRESVKTHNKKMSKVKGTRYQILGEDDRFSMPLWVVEGFAEWVAQKFDSTHYDPMIYRTILGNNHLRRHVTDLSQNLPDIAHDMYFNPYYFGVSFFNWLEKIYGKEKIIEFFIQRPHYKTEGGKTGFERAWEKTFGREISEMHSIRQTEMQIEWKDSLIPYFKPYFTDTLQSITERVTWPINKEKGEKEPLLAGYVSHDASKVIYYTLDPKWQARIEVRDLFTNETWIVHKMSTNKSLWYRFDNAPAIEGNKVAVVINREGQDELRIYKLRQLDLIKKRNIDKILWTKEKTAQVAQIDSLRHHAILTINTPSFNHDGTKLVFEGIARNGFSDLYLWNRETDTLSRLTNDVYEDLRPRFERINKTSSEAIVFISDRINPAKMDVFTLWPETKEITSLYQPNQPHTVIDQISVSPDSHFVAMRMVSLDHSPQILIWSPPHNVYHVFSTFYGVSQIVDWIDNNTLLLLDERFKLAKFHLNDLKMYAPIPTTYTAMKKTTWQPIQPDTLIKPTPITGKKKKYRYLTPLGLGSFGFASATGEEIYLSSNLYIYYGSGLGWFYSFSVGRIDMRQRLRKFYSFTASRDLNLRTLENSKPYYNFRLQQITRFNWVLDHNIRLTANFYWPFDFENGIGLSASIGWFGRDYEYVFPYYYYYYSMTRSLNRNTLKPLPHQKPLNPKAQKYMKTISPALYHGWSKQSMASVIESIGKGALLGTGIYFLHDKTFSSMYGEVNRGTWLATQLDVLAVNKKILEGQFIFDGRFYIQIKNSRALIANRLYVVKSLGSDKPIFLTPRVLEKQKFPYYNTKLGTDAILKQIEFRFPILNFIVFQPALVPPNSPEGIMGFWVNGSLFYNSGNIWFYGTEMPQIKRAGLAIKLRIFGNISLQHEQYKMKYGAGPWTHAWKKGWFLNFEF